MAALAVSGARDAEHLGNGSRVLALITPATSSDGDAREPRAALIMDGITR